MKLRTTLAVLALVFVPAAALAEDMNSMSHMDTDKASPADKAFMDSMQKMMKDMDVKPTGKPDKDFVMMMMPHHQGAIDMARVELQYGKDATLRKMAGEIVNAQEKEIGEMKSWLSKNGK